MHVPLVSSAWFCSGEVLLVIKGAADTLAAAVEHMVG
jgi:microcompartment protein CcmL/EutN